VKFGFVLLLVLSVAGCTESDVPARQERNEQQTSKVKGKHGLRIELTGPEKVSGGELFEIDYTVTDDEGELRGVMIEWGDGKTWGGMPFDLVCSSVSGEEKPSEKGTDKREQLTHAYRQPRRYEVAVSAYTGGCFTHWDRTTANLSIQTTGTGEELNGPMEPRAKIGHAYYTDGDPSVLVSDIGGYDEDGFVQRIEIDWGDDSTEVMEQPWEFCDPKEAGYPGGWFSEPRKHAYEEPGDYVVAIEVESAGCDGETVQTDSATRTLEFPPRQGS
jgi:hypothetical protein